MRPCVSRRGYVLSVPVLFLGALRLLLRLFVSSFRSFKVRRCRPPVGSSSVLTVSTFPWIGRSPPLDLTIVTLLLPRFGMLLRWFLVLPDRLLRRTPFPRRLARFLSRLPVPVLLLPPPTVLLSSRARTFRRLLLSVGVSAATGVLRSAMSPPRSACVCGWSFFSSRRHRRRGLRLISSAADPARFPARSICSPASTPASSSSCRCLVACRAAIAVRMSLRVGLPCVSRVQRSSLVAAALGAVRSSADRVAIPSLVNVAPSCFCASSPCAGRAVSRALGRGAGSVHPRACGANQVRLAITDTHRGASPRVRGDAVERYQGFKECGASPLAGGTLSTRCSPSVGPFSAGLGAGSIREVGAPTWSSPPAADAASVNQLQRPIACRFHRLRASCHAVDPERNQ